MDKYGVRTQKWVVGNNPADIIKATKTLNGKEFVVKAQILAGMFLFRTSLDSHSDI